MTGDMLIANDSATLELHVVTMPATLSYDGGAPGSTMYWNGPGGFANRFVPPVYPCSIMSGRVYMGMQLTPSNPSVGIFDDDLGPVQVAIGIQREGGRPGPLHAALESRPHRARIEHILAQVEALVDPGEHQVGRRRVIRRCGCGGFAG